MSEVKLNVPKMSCAHCKATIENTGNALTGVDSISADPETKEVDIVFDEGRVSLEEIRKALEEAGYPAE